MCSRCVAFASRCIADAKPTRPGALIPESTTAQFHAVRAGGCWLRLPGGRPVRLEEGDFVLLPHGDAHEILCNPETKAMGLHEVLALAGSSDCRVLRLTGSGPFTALACGGCDFGNRAHKSLFSFQPKFVHFHAKESAALRPVLDLADQELREPRPASSIVLARLGGHSFHRGDAGLQPRVAPRRGILARRHSGSEHRAGSPVNSFGSLKLLEPGRSRGQDCHVALFAGNPLSIARRHIRHGSEHGVSFFKGADAIAYRMDSP